LWWTADPPRPFQLRPVPICSALRFLVAGLLPAFVYRRISRLSQGTAYPYRVTLMVRPLLWQNPVRVTRPVPPGRLPFSSALFTFRRVGLPAHSHSVGRRPRGLRRPVPICRFSSYDSGLATLLAWFQSVDLLRSIPASRPSSLASSLSTFSVRFRSFDLLRFSCDPNLAIGWLLSTGDLNYSQKLKLSKQKKCYLACLSNHKYQ